MTNRITQECGCVINVYSDGSAGGAEIGEWCDPHGSVAQIKYERDMLLMLILDNDEYGDGALECAQVKLKTMRLALDACLAFIKWERSSLEHGKPRDTQLLVDAMVQCHKAVMVQKERAEQGEQQCQ